MVPMLALGIPGDGGTVVMMGALTIHSVIPGVRLFSEQPDLVTQIFVLLLVANLFMVEVFVRSLMCFAAAIAMTTGIAFAEYPEKPIDVLVPFGGGSGPDASFRMLQPDLDKILGQPVVVRNVGGAGGTVGAAQFARHVKDGYKLGFMPVGTTTTQPQLRKLPYSDKSFAPICMTIQDPMAVGVAPDSGLNSLADLINKAKSGTVTSGGPPPGSLPHIAQAALAAAYGVKFKYVPHKGGHGTAKSILGGKVDVLVDPLGSTLNYGL